MARLRAVDNKPFIIHAEKSNGLICFSLSESLLTERALPLHATIRSLLGVVDQKHAWIVTDVVHDPVH